MVFAALRPRDLSGILSCLYLSSDQQSPRRSVSRPAQILIGTGDPGHLGLDAELVDNQTPFSAPRSPPSLPRPRQVDLHILANRESLSDSVPSINIASHGMYCLRHFLPMFAPRNSSANAYIDCFSRLLRHHTLSLSSLYHSHSFIVHGMPPFSIS
jgi:hypothetical protein